MLAERWERRARVGGIDDPQPMAAVVDELGGGPGRQFDFPLLAFLFAGGTSLPRGRRL